MTMEASVLRQRIETTLSADTNLRRQAELDLRRVSTLCVILIMDCSFVC